MILFYFSSGRSEGIIIHAGYTYKETDTRNVKKFIQAHTAMSLPVLPTQRLPFSGFARKRRQRGRASTEGFSLLSHCACASKGRDPCMAHGRTLMSGDARSLHSLGATQQPRQESRHMLGGTLAPNRLLSFFFLLSLLFVLHLSLSFFPISPPPVKYDFRHLRENHPQGLLC